MPATSQPEPDAPTVMVVDDDSTALILAEETLTSQGFNVEAFKSPQTALTAAIRKLPDIVVLDVMMPEMDGFTLCARLRALPRAEDLPILILTTLEDAESIQRAYRAGATEFDTKPVNWGIESHRLRYLLRTAAISSTLRAREAETRQVRDDWEKTFNSIQDVVTVINRDFRIEKANAATATTMGLPLNQICGALCHEIFCRQSSPCAECSVRRAIDTRLAASAEMTYGPTGGIWHVNASPIVELDGGVNRAVHVARDITQRKQLEAGLWQAQKMEAIGTLAGGIAHEFNNLFQVVLGSADLLGMDLTEPEALASVEAMRQAAQNGGALARKLLTFSLRQNECSPKGTTDLNRIIQDVRQMLELILPRSLKIEFDLAPVLPPIQGSPDQLEQTVINLVMNGAQSMAQSGTITIRTEAAMFDTVRLPPTDLPAGNFVVLSITDTGHGMDKKTVDRIFEPFFTTRGLGQGTGLGLSVVYGIVQDHNGHILCDSAPGRGTTFRLYFPALTPVATPAAAPARNHILVVDDEAPIRRLLEKFLTRAGFTVTTLPDGPSTIKKCCEEGFHPDLVLLDLGLPGMSGWEVLTALRQCQPPIRVFISSGYSGPDITQRAASQGAIGVTTKPYALDNLRLLVQQALGSIPGQAPPPCHQPSPPNPEHEHAG